MLGNWGREFIKTLSSLADFDSIALNSRTPSLGVLAMFANRLTLFGLIGSLSLCVVAPARAWETFHDTKTVKLPPQKVSLQLSEPSVMIKDRSLRALGASPVVGTLYMPLQTAPLGFGFLNSAPAPAPAPSALDETLQKALESEHYAIKSAGAKAAFEAEVKAHVKLMQKLAPSDVGPDAVPSDIKDKLDAINKRLDSFDARLTSVEKLLLIHDNYLRKQIEQIPPPKGPDMPKQ
jgi:hypothetical protein